PAQTKRKIRLSGTHHLRHGAFEELLSVKPVMVIDETVNTVLSSQRGLRRARLRCPEIVKAQIGGQVRLIVPGKPRPRLRYVRPFRKPFSPPGVVLRNRMELREMNGQEPHVCAWLVAAAAAVVENGGQRERLTMMFSNLAEPERNSRPQR